MIEKNGQCVTIFVLVFFWQDDYEAKWQMIVTSMNEYEQRFREAFFIVVLPWISVTFRGTNQRRERRFVRDWVEERFLWALEEKVIFQRWDYRNASHIDVALPVSIAWHDNVWRFDNNGRDNNFIIVQNSSGVVRWFYWWRLECEPRYRCPRYAVTRWLHDIHVWYYRGSILVVADSTYTSSNRLYYC